MPALASSEFQSPPKHGLAQRGFLTPASSGSLRISWLRFFWAMAQTSIAREAVPRWEVMFEAFGHAARYWRHFAADASMVLKPGRAKYYKDADSKHFASRVGEAAGVLFAKENLGYVSVVHLEVARQQLGVGRASGKGKKADFVLEGPPGLAMADMKGSFDQANRPDKLHGYVRAALRQTAQSVTRFPLPVQREFGILTVLRESGQAQTSEIMWADPEGDTEPDPLKRRAISLGATSRLFALAGFDGLADSADRIGRLSNETSSRERVPEPLVVDRMQVAGQGFLFAIPKSVEEMGGTVPARIGLREDFVQAARRADWDGLVRLRGVVDAAHEADVEGVEIFRDGTAIMDDHRLRERGERLADFTEEEQ